MLGQWVFHHGRAGLLPVLPHCSGAFMMLFDFVKDSLFIIEHIAAVVACAHGVVDESAKELKLTENTKAMILLRQLHWPISADETA